MGIQGHWELRINFHLGKAKGRSKRGVWVGGQKWGFTFCKIPIIKTEIQTLSHKLLESEKLLTTTTVIGMPKSNWYAVTFKWFWAVLSWSKNLCVFLRNKYDFQIGNAMENINSVLTRKKCSKWLDTPCIWIFWTCWFQWHRFWDCIFRAICIHYLGNCSDFQAYFGNTFPLLNIDFFFKFFGLGGVWSKQPQNIHILVPFWLGKMHQNGLSGT